MPVLLRAVLVTLAIIAAPWALLPAQETQAETSLTAGQRTRVTFDRWRKPLVGQLVSADSSGVALQLPERGEIVTVSWDDVAHVDVSVGRRSRGSNVGRGMMYGLATGAAIGGTAVLVSWFSDADERCTSDCWVSPTASWVIVSVLATAGTTLIGGVVGAAWPTDRWTRVPLEGDPPRLMVRPLPSGGMALGLSLRGR